VCVCRGTRTRWGATGNGGWGGGAEEGGAEEGGAEEGWGLLLSQGGCASVPLTPQVALVSSMAYALVQYSLCGGFDAAAAGRFRLV
jgi:hypothetical protein